MSKLYFKYGVMGSSKTANLLITKYNYEQKGFNVLLLKPFIDTRDYENGEIVVKTRIGLYSKCFGIKSSDDIVKVYNDFNAIKPVDVIMVDEAQFLTEGQVDALHEIANKIPVLCYGLLTDFTTKLFEGSKRLVETAESLQEIKTICSCGRKATCNARFINGEMTTSGTSVAIEKGNVTYEAMCYRCYNDLKRNKL